MEWGIKVFYILPKYFWVVIIVIGICAISHKFIKDKNMSKHKYNKLFYILGFLICLLAVDSLTTRIFYESRLLIKCIIPLLIIFFTSILYYKNYKEKDYQSRPLKNKILEILEFLFVIIFLMFLLFR